MLVRDHHVALRLNGPTTLPVGFGGPEPQLSEMQLEQGDRLLCFTDGLIEEHATGEEEFGEDQLIDWVNQLDRTGRRDPGGGALPVPYVQAGAGRAHHG